MTNLTEDTRRRLYDTALALAAVAVVYGLISDAEAVAWIAVLTPWIGLARANVGR
ncbi:hypothetical protein [Aeromicrobium sp.]|uniref:hypothetical protein n=1 Tax=Aeromicrobium sp. TaxID=1871063 RepID=UPI0030BF5F73